MIADCRQTSTWHGIRLPVWLYLKREYPAFKDVTIRWGSRRPLRLVYTKVSDPYMPTTRMLAIWRLHMAHGPGEGIAEGMGGALHRWRVFYRPSGMGYGIGWER